MLGGSNNQFEMILAAPMSGCCARMRRKSRRTCSFSSIAFALKNQREGSCFLPGRREHESENSRLSIRGSWRRLQYQDTGCCLARRKRFRRHIAFDSRDPYLRTAPYFLFKLRPNLRITICMQGGLGVSVLECEYLRLSSQVRMHCPVVDHVSNEKLVVLSVDVGNQNAHASAAELHTEISDRF